jgi:hypothetical protein
MHCVRLIAVHKRHPSHALHARWRGLETAFLLLLSEAPISCRQPQKLQVAALSLVHAVWCAACLAICFSCRLLAHDACWSHGGCSFVRFSIHHRVRAYMRNGRASGCCKRCTCALWRSATPLTLWVWTAAGIRARRCCISSHISCSHASCAASICGWGYWISLAQLQHQQHMSLGASFHSSTRCIQMAAAFLRASPQRSLPSSVFARHDTVLSSCTCLR